MYQKIQKNIIPTQNRLVSLTNFPSTTIIYSIEGESNSCKISAMHQNWYKSLNYASPSLDLLSQVLIKVLKDQVNQVIFVTLTWQTHP